MSVFAVFKNWFIYSHCTQYLRYIKSKVGDRSQGQPEGSLFISYYTEGVGEGATPFLYSWYLIVQCVKQGCIEHRFSVFGMTRPGIEPRSPRPLVNIYIQWNRDLRKHHHTKNSEYETGFDEISIPFNEKIFNIWKRKSKVPPDSDSPRIHFVTSRERFVTLLIF